MKRFFFLIFIFVLTASAGFAQDAPLPDVLAVVNGVKITVNDFDVETSARIEELKRQVVEARKLELDLQINSMLLEAEAKKRGVTTSKILEDEVLTKVKQPTDADARKYFNAQYTDGTDRSAQFEQVKERIMAHLLGEQRQALAKQLADRLRSTAEVKVLVETATPPSKPADRGRVFAVVNGKQITSGDVEDSLQPLIVGVQEEIYELRRRDLNRKINDVLLAQEAQKRQITTRALLDAEVTAKAPSITDAQAQKFYDDNKEKMRGGAFADVKPQIVSYLQNAEMDKLRLTFAATLHKNAAVQDFLVAPPPPVYEIATDDQPAIGDAKAKVTLVEFTDFQCGTCGQFQPVLDRVVKEYNGRVRLVVRDYPLPQHTNAFKAAEAAEAAREQNKYWEYAAKLFSNQSALEVEKLKQYATDLALDRSKFDAALDGGKFKQHVQRDLRDGNRVGIRGTPTLFLNGRQVSDRSYEGLKRAIDAALGSGK